MASSQDKSKDDLAFSLSVIAYDYDYPERAAHTILKVTDCTKKGIAEKAANYTGDVPPIAPNEAELALDGPGKDVIWVGMRPFDVSDNEQHKLKNVSINGADNFKIIPTDPRALRVVVPFGKTNWNYFCLLDRQETGLCTAYQTSKDEVFFFKEFRNDASLSYQGRKNALSEQVRKFCGVKDHITWPNQYDKTKFHIEPLHSMTSQVTSLLAAYQVSKDPSNLKDVLGLIDQTVGKEPHPELEDNRVLWKLVIGKEYLTEEEIELGVEQFKHLAKDLDCEKDLPNLTLDNFRRFSRARVASGIVLEYRQLRLLLVAFLSDLGVKEAGGGGDTTHIKEMHKWVVIGLGPKIQVDETLAGGFKRFVQTEAKKFRDIESLAEKGITSLKESQGAIVVAQAPSLAHIFSKYGTSNDMDSAKLMFSHIHAYNVQALRQVLEGVLGEMATHALALEKLSSTLPDDEEEEEDEDEEEEAEDEEEEEEEEEQEEEE